MWPKGRNMVERLFNLREGMKKDDPYKGEMLGGPVLQRAVPSWRTRCYR